MMIEYTKLDPVSRLSRDQRAAAVTLGRDEARFLVDAYYMMQKDRIRSGNQVTALSAEAEPHETLIWLQEQSATLEAQLKGALKRYADAHPIGIWAQSQKGIGPVIAAGLLSRLELRPTVGAWWRFAGLDPTMKWGKGEKRPFNMQLKRLCWIMGESFTKVSGHDDAVYGKLYRQRKEYEIARNEAGGNAEIAARTLTEKNYGKDTNARKAYEQGKLPDGRINLRAQRFAVKIFLSHLHEVWHWEETGTAPPNPFVIEHMGHAHKIPVPNWTPPR